MKLTPIMTEKSLKETKRGGFTFWVPRELDKIQIRNLIQRIFGVHVVSVKTINLKGGIKRNAKGQMQKVKAGKKAIVILKEGEKIDLFEEKKKVKKSAKKKGTK